MRKILAGLLAAAMLAAMTGCQATPEKPAVIQKDLEQMIGMAQQTPVQTQGALAQRLGAPERLQAELVSAKGKLLVHVDAAVTLPDVPSIPTVRVGMGRFSQEDVKRLYDTLCGNAVPVSPLDTQLTQAYKMRQIKDLMEQKQSGKLDDMKYESMEQPPRFLRYLSAGCIFQTRRRTARILCRPQSAGRTRESSRRRQYLHWG